MAGGGAVGRTNPRYKEEIGCRFRAKMETPERVKGILPESQGQNPALTVILHGSVSPDNTRQRCRSKWEEGGGASLARARDAAWEWST